MKDHTAAVLDFWFGAGNGTPPNEAREFWFKSTPELDAEIRDRFQETFDLANAGAFDERVETSDDYLAMILIFDQFPRNMFRGTPGAFATDDKALEWAKSAVALGHDMAQAAPHRRIFVYMPFEHSEQLEDQEESVRLISALGNAEYTKYAVAHRDVIAEYGRFPHRNHILGRQSNENEEAYLSQPGAGF